MKRFFCTECNKIKRVRKFPTRISQSDAKLPVARTGQCNHHLISSSLHNRYMKGMR